MTQLRRGTADSPLELRPGEVDRFYFVFSDVLASGDLLTGTPTVTSDGATVTSVARNSQPLTLDGVTHAVDTVVECVVSAMTLGDMAELICAAATTSGRGLKASLFVRAVAQYA